MKQFTKSNQEQAVASWVNYLNQMRLDTLLTALSGQGQNLQNALGSVDQALTKIGQEIVGRNRGGLKGMHGFIAEVAQVGVGNAKELIQGNDRIYLLKDDNGPVDLTRGGIDIQQKFSQAGGRFSLGAVVEHMQKYPNFVRNGGMYQIPRDHYETVQKLQQLSEKEASRLLATDGEGLSVRDWRRVNELFASQPIDIDTLEPANFEYSEVQRGVYETTLEAEKQSLHSTDESLREQALQDSRPKLQEGINATAIAASIEGGTAFVLAVQAKRKGGKQLKEFDSEDWGEILGDTRHGTVNGGVRGLSLYALTNFTATSAAVASSLVTASFGVAEQANRLRNDEISELEFIGNAELLCLETAVSAVFSLAGQAVIPVPVLGAVLGNSIGQIMYKAASTSLSKREAKLIAHYQKTQRELDAKLAADFDGLLASLDDSLATYLDLLDRAFDPDPGTALLGSVELARSVGVPAKEILDSHEKTMAYFLD